MNSEEILADLLALLYLPLDKWECRRGEYNLCSYYLTYRRMRITIGHDEWTGWNLSVDIKGTKGPDCTNVGKYFCNFGKFSSAEEAREKFIEIVRWIIVGVGFGDLSYSEVFGKTPVVQCNVCGTFYLKPAGIACPSMKCQEEKRGILVDAGFTTKILDTDTYD